MYGNMKSNFYFQQIECSIGNLFTKRGYSHEENRIEEYKKFLENYSTHDNFIYDNYMNNLLNLEKEEDVATLPYKPESAKDITRRFSIHSLTDNKYILKQAFAIITCCSLSKSGKIYKRIISRLKKDKKKKLNYDVILPEKSSNDYIEFNFKTNPKNLYIIVITISNGKTYVCQPIINRSFKHYTQRQNDNLFELFKKEKKIGMLYYHYNTIINENGIIKSPSYKLDVYEIDFKELKYSQVFSNDLVIEILKSMKSYKEKLAIKRKRLLNKQSKINNYPPSPVESETSENQ